MNFKTYILLILATFSAKLVESQTYGNEWINYSQKYYAFNVNTSGIHKIDYTALSNSGIPVGTFSSQNILG